MTNGFFSYIIKILENSYIGQIYCGAALRKERGYPSLAPIPFAGFSNNDKTPVRFEYPSYGNGDFRQAAFRVRFAGTDGSGVVEPVYRSHRIYEGKKDIRGLPSTYVERQADAETLELELEDRVSGLNIILYYTIFAGWNCVARHVSFINTGTRALVLENAMSLSLDLPDCRWNMITLTGAWVREFEVTDAPLRTGFQGVQSMRGISSAQANPALILRRPATTEHHGEALGFSLVYSGNFTACAEADTIGFTRVRLGVNPDTFSWELQSGASFDTPEAVIAWTDEGLNGLSHQFHSFYRSHLVRGAWRDAERPVLLNNWEGTYFDFTEAKILDMARGARDLGVELFVLDDGWFGARNNDKSSLGDWFPHNGKLPNGIAGLAEKITALGVKFGLWIEPEMVSPDSELFRAHPDWAVHIPGRPRTEARYQYVLDMGREDVVEYLVEAISRIITNAPISYIKWDMNRPITEPYSLSLPPERQGEFFHRYMLGVYDLYARLTRMFSHVLFESCCSGGGRFDPGMIAFAPQGWLSDNTDGLARIAIQEGASLVYPLSSMGAHVSAVPNHQTGRLCPINFRAMTAFFGCLGYELDPTTFTDEEKDAVKRQIAFYKAHRATFQYGRFYRLVSPVPGRDGADGRFAAWMVVSPDEKEAVAGVYKILAKPAARPLTLKLAGLEAFADYDVSLWEEGGFAAVDKEANSGRRGGDELMQSGLLLDCAFGYGPHKGDFFSELFVLTKVAP